MDVAAELGVPRCPTPFAGSAGREDTPAGRPTSHLLSHSEGDVPQHSAPRPPARPYSTAPLVGLEEVGGERGWAALAQECPFGCREAFISSGLTALTAATLLFLSVNRFGRPRCLPESQSKPGLCRMVERGCRNIGSGVRGVMFGFLLVENASYSGLGCLICSQTCFFIRLQRGCGRTHPG